MFLRTSIRRRVSRRMRHSVPRLRGPECLEDRVTPGFLAPVTYGVGQFVVSVKVGDFNGGGLDLAVANNDSETVSVLLNNGDGTFKPATHYPAGPEARGLAVGHFHDPNILDLAVANDTGPNGTVSILLNNGDGTFAPKDSYSIGPVAAAVRVAVGDFNTDGITDLATVNRTGNIETSVSILRGNGDGSFASPLVYQLGDINWGTDLDVGDVNGDGRTDIVASGLRGLGVLLGTGTGRFRIFSVEDTSPITSVALADLTQDGRLDLVIGGNDLFVRIGNGDGTFQPPVELLDKGISDAAVGDFNRDRLADIVATHFSNALSVFLGNGDGTFRPPQSFNPGPDNGAVAVGRLNNDRFPDLAVGNQEFASVAVLLNDKNWSGRSAAGDSLAAPSAHLARGFEPNLGSRGGLQRELVITVSAASPQAAEVDCAQPTGTARAGIKSQRPVAAMYPVVVAEDVLAASPFTGQQSPDALPVYR